MLALLNVKQQEQRSRESSGNVVRVEVGMQVFPAGLGDAASLHCRTDDPRKLIVPCD